MVWWKLGGGASPHASARPHRTLLPSLLTHSSSSSLPPLSGGSLRTSTRTKIGRARMTHLQSECSYLQTTRGGGGGDSTSVECLLSTPPLPDPTGPVVPAVHQQRGAVTVVFRNSPCAAAAAAAAVFTGVVIVIAAALRAAAAATACFGVFRAPAHAVVAEGLPREARAGRQPRLEGRVPGARAVTSVFISTGTM